MSQREKTLLLVGLVLIVCSLMILEWLEPPDQPSSDSQLHVGKAMNNSPFPQAGFALNISETKRTMTLKDPRNIFAPLKDPHVPKKVQAPPPPPPRPIQSPPPPRPIHPPPPPRPTPPPPRPTGPSAAELAVRQARQEMQQYKFFGYLTKEGIQQGFLSRGKTIYIVKKGEPLEKGIAVKSLDASEVILSKYVKQADTTVEAALPLTKKDKQGTS